MVSRFFAAAAVWGRLVLRDIRDADSWNPERVTYWDETYLDGVSRLALAGEKVRSATELDAAVAASGRPPGIRPLWIQEELLGEALLRWQATSAPARPASAWRWRAPAAFATAVAAVFLAGHALSVAPQRQSPPRLAEDAPHVGTAAQARLVTAASSRSLVIRPRRSGAAPARVAAPAQTRPTVWRPTTARYAVDVGTFASSDAADRMRHQLLRKGYMVVVLRSRGVSHVVTPPYATRALADDVVRGMKASGIPRAAVTGMGL